MGRRKARDANEPEIIRHLEAQGYYVLRQENPDLLVFAPGLCVPMEVKMPLGPKGGKSDTRLTPQQQEIQDRAPEPSAYRIVRSPEEADDAIAIAYGDAMNGAIAWFKIELVKAGIGPGDESAA